MFNFASASQLLGERPDAEPPHCYEIGEFGYLVFEDDSRASVVIGERIVDTRIIETCGSSPETKLPIYLSSTPGGLLCYHLVSPGPKDETDQLFAELDSLIESLATAS